MTPLVVIGVLLFCAFGLPPALLLLFGWLAAPHRTNGYLGEPRWFCRKPTTGEKALALHVGQATKRSALK